MDSKKYYKERAEHEEIMNNEVERVMEIMDDRGYQFCDHIDYDYSHQFVKVESTHGCRIVSWIWAVPKREEFKDVLKWFASETKFYGVTGFMKYDGKEECVAKGRYRPIPTFYSAEDVERWYDTYFGY